MPDLPIACTLTPEGLTARLALIEALSANGLIDRTPTDAGPRVRLRDTSDIEQRTRELVAAESACCAFLDFDLGREDGELVLEISRAGGRAPGDRDVLRARGGVSAVSSLRRLLVAVLVGPAALAASRFGGLGGSPVRPGTIPA